MVPNAIDCKRRLREDRLQSAASEECDEIEDTCLQATAMDNEQATTASYDYDADDKNPTARDNCKRRLQATTASLMPAMEPTASDDCDENDNDDEHSEPTMRATTTTTTTTPKAAALEDHPFLEECQHLDEVVHLATTGCKRLQATGATKFECTRLQTNATTAIDCKLKATAMTTMTPMESTASDNCKRRLR